MRPAPDPDPAASASAPASWRKRHPIRARLLLYGVGLALGGLAFFLLAGRKELERQDHVAFLWSRLEALPVVLQADANGGEVLKVLDAEYADPALPAPLRARVERLRGVVARNRKDRAGVDGAYERARALDPAAVRLSDLEWAQCLVDLGDAAAARAHLPPAGERSGWCETIWNVLVRAQVDALAGEPELARAALVTALDNLPRPLPPERPTWFGLSAWQPAGAALEATRWLLLDPGAGKQAAAAAWRRLALLAPHDFDALWACAEGLLGAGDESAARAALARADAADAEGLRKALARRPDLARLHAR